MEKLWQQKGGTRRAEVVCFQFLIFSPTVNRLNTRSEKKALDHFTVTTTVVKIDDYASDLPMMEKKQNQCFTNFEAVLIYTKFILHSSGHMGRQMGGEKRRNKLFLFVFNEIWLTGFM